MMTELLQQAFAQAARLPEQAQDALAIWILEEVAFEQRYQDIVATMSIKLPEPETDQHTCIHH